MYAILMRKEVLSNDVFLYNPITVIEGEYNKDFNVFVDNFNNEFCMIDDVSFSISELSQGIYFPIDKKELLSKYSTEDIEEALNYYQADILM